MSQEVPAEGDARSSGYGVRVGGRVYYRILDVVDGVVSERCGIAVDEPDEQPGASKDRLPEGLTIVDATGQAEMVAAVALAMRRAADGNTGMAYRLGYTSGVAQGATEVGQVVAERVKALGSGPRPRVALDDLWVDVVNKAADLSCDGSVQIAQGLLERLALIEAGLWRDEKMSVVLNVSFHVVAGGEKRLLLTKYRSDAGEARTGANPSSEPGHEELVAKVRDVGVPEFMLACMMAIQHIETERSIALARDAGLEVRLVTKQAEGERPA